MTSQKFVEDIIPAPTGVDAAAAAPASRDGWPEPVSAAELCANPPQTPPVLVEGLLYQGGTMMFSGPSKARKTFTGLGLAASIASGRPWLGMSTTQSPVLYVNLELQDFAVHERVTAICSAMGIEPPKDLHLWNLRGQMVGLPALQVSLPAKIAALNARLVAIDPLYKVSAVSKVEENNNDALGALLASLEAICTKAGAALVLCHHFAKGDHAAKNAIDRASGGGVLARWPDVVMSLTPHEEEDAMVADLSLRNFAPKPPLGLRWEYPVWTVDPTLDVSKLKAAGGKPRCSAERVLAVLDPEGMTYTEWRTASGLSDTTFRRRRGELMDAGRVHQHEDKYVPATPPPEPPRR